MRYKLMVEVERFDGSLFKQCVRHLTEEEAKDKELIHRLIQNYLKHLGHGYYIVDWYLDYAK